MAQLCAMLAGVNATMQQMQSKMDTNALEAKKQIDTNAQQMENKMETSTYEIKTNACV